MPHGRRRMAPAPSLDTINQAWVRDATREDWLGKRIILSKSYSGYPKGAELCVTDVILTASGKRRRLVLEGGKSILADKIENLFTLAGSSSSGGLGSVDLPCRDPSKQKKSEAIIRVFRSLKPTNGVLGVDRLLKELRPHLPSSDTNHYLSLKESGVLEFGIGCWSCWLKQEAEHSWCNLQHDEQPQEAFVPLVHTENIGSESRNGMKIRSLHESLPGVTESVQRGLGSNAAGQTRREDTPKEKLLAQSRCWEWLKGLDGGRGTLLNYWEALLAEFDGDLVQVAAACCPTDFASGIFDTVDAELFEALGIQSVEHKILFARGMANL